MEEVNLVEVEIEKPNLKSLSFADARKETAGDTFKHWNKLLKSQSIENTENFKEILSPSKPLSSFEEKLRLILIDTLQLKAEVINVLLSQNDYFIKRALRCKWFFQNLSSEFCIQKIFPAVSVSVRFKIINRLSKCLENEEEAENLVTFIASNYGYEGAEILLPKCSNKFILNYCQKQRPLVTYPIQKRKRILHKICKRYPEIGLHILEFKFCKKDPDTYDLRSGYSILQYLAGNHIDLFIPFFKKHIQKLNSYDRIFSRKLSWKLIKKLNNFFFESRLINSEILNIKNVFSKFDTSDQIKCLSTLVRLENDKLTLKNWFQARIKLACLIKCIGPRHRYSMITSVFKEVYGLNFQDHSKCWYFDLLEILPSEDRQYFAENIEKYYLSSEAKFKEYLDPECIYDQQKIENAIYLYEFPVAFVKFKSIIRKSPDKYRRENIIFYMLKCCQINNDLKGLKDVVDFVSTHHRNEDLKILYSFTCNICDMFPALTSSICQKVKKLILFCLAKGSFGSWSFLRLAVSDIYLTLESDKDANHLIKEFFEFGILKSGNWGPYLSNYKNKHARTLVLAVGELTKEWILTHPIDKTSEQLHSTWITTCEKYNEVNRKNKVYLKDVPGYAEALVELYKNKYKKLGVEDWPLEALETCEINALNINALSKLYCHFLKKNPEVVIKHLESVLDHLDGRSYPILVKQLTFLGVIDKLKELILNNFQRGNSFEKRRCALKMYSQICTIEEFTDVIQEYIPQDDRIKEGADYNFIQIQLMVPGIIKRIRPLWKNLNLILKFFRGDFLEKAVFSLYATCWHSRVDFIVPFLKELISKVPQRVSYTKDIIRLIIMLSNHDESIIFCLRCWQDNKHYTIRKIILKFLRKMFLEEPTQELFTSLVNCILESEEVMFHDEKPDIGGIPKEFVNEYATVLWKIYKSFIISLNFQKMLIWNFNLDNINLLSDDFCEEVMREYFFNPVPLMEAGKFAAFYCAAGTGTVETRIKKILKLMRESQMDAQKAISFLKIIRNESRAKPAQFLNVISTLLENWPDSSSLYEEKLLYKYYEIYYRLLQNSSERSRVSVMFAKRLKLFLESMKSMRELIIIIVDTLKQFIEEIKSTGLPFHPLSVVSTLMKESNHRMYNIIALGVLSPEISELYEKGDGFENAVADKETLNEICQYLENEGENAFVLWIYFRRVLKDSKPVIRN